MQKKDDYETISKHFTRKNKIWISKKKQNVKFKNQPPTYI